MSTSHVRRTFFATPLVVALAFSLAGCDGGGGGLSVTSASSFGSEVAQQWFGTPDGVSLFAEGAPVPAPSINILELIKTTPGFSPPVASRALGYAGATLYETVYPGMGGYRSLAGLMPGLGVGATPPVVHGAKYHWPAAVNVALASIIRNLFANTSQGNKDAIDALEANLAAQYQGQTDPATYARSVERGAAVAAAIWNWSLNDGGAFGTLTNTSPGYVPPVGPGLWEPTPPGFAPALQAAWGNNRCFVIPDGSSCDPGSPPTFSTDPASAFYAEAEETRVTVNNLTAEQLAIANFWADGGGTITPPGHWFSIFGQIAAAQNLKLDRAAETYCRLGFGASDAFVACWHGKYKYNLLRPVTYIQQFIQPGWTPPLTTPPFPEYLSGHSTVSGASAAILTALYGDQFAFTDMSHDAVPLPARSFTSFNEAAEEAAISRLYGGIHFRSAIDVGVDAGRSIGHAVMQLPLGPTSAPTGPATSTYDAAVANAWFDQINELVRTTAGFSPPVASRALGYAGVAVYEACRPGIPGATSLAGHLNDLTPMPKPLGGAAYHWPSAVNAAAASIASDLFRSTTTPNKDAIAALELQFANQFQSAAPAATIARSIAFGRAVADAVYFWSRSDGGHEGFATNFPSSYVPPVGPGLWVPTAPGFQSALQPFWGSNRPLALEEGSAADPGAPPPFSTTPGSVFHTQALEVYDTVNNLTPGQLAIANWWADGGGTYTPPGHSMAITRIALVQTAAKLDKAATAYAAVGVSVADAFISCWHAKYKYNLMRPLTYVLANIDSGWIIPLATPPFPEYTSGHSVQSGASAEVLTALFGPNFSFVDDTNANILSAPSRTFSSFFEAAEEAAISRLYGGIHFRAAIDIGVQQGRTVGKAALALPFPSLP